MDLGSQPMSEILLSTSLSFPFFCRVGFILRQVLLRLWQEWPSSVPGLCSLGKAEGEILFPRDCSASFGRAVMGWRGHVPFPERHGGKGWDTVMAIFGSCPPPPPPAWGWGQPYPNSQVKSQGCMVSQSKIRVLFLDVGGRAVGRDKSDMSTSGNFWVILNILFIYSFIFCLSAFSKFLQWTWITCNF